MNSQKSTHSTQTEDQPLAFAESNFSGVIGVGRADITPPLGIYDRNWGAANHDIAEGIHRPLCVTALALSTLQQDREDQQEQESPCVLIAMDIGWFKTKADEWYLRSAVIEAFSLDPARVIMNQYHSHSSPSTCRDDAHQPGGHLIAPYMEQVREALLEATQQALATARPATLTWKYGRCDLAQDRDLPDPDSDKARIICGFNPTKRADDTLLVGRVSAHNGDILATVVNYACHPTTLGWDNRLISPDYIGAMREVVENVTHVPCLFLQGASGELAPREQYVGDTAVADKNGRQLGYAVLSSLEGMLPPDTRLAFVGAAESGAPLAIWQRYPDQAATALSAVCITVDLPLKQDLLSAPEIEAQISQCSDRTLTERLVRKRRVREWVGDGPTCPLPIWIWRVGDAVIIGHALEAYSQFQIELRRTFAGQAVVCMNVVNGTCGYLPPQELYDQEIYQVWQTPFDRGSLEKVTDACIQALRSEEGLLNSD